MLDEQIPLGLTFDDVILIPQYSELLPHEVETRIQHDRPLQNVGPIYLSFNDT